MNSIKTVLSGMKTRKTLCLLLVLSFALALFPSIGGFEAVAARTDQGPLDNVQVSIQTTGSLPNYYVASAYNESGALVASYQSQYPAASFQLPSGRYLFAATASVYPASYYPPFAYPGTVAAGQPASVGASPSYAMPCCYKQPLTEYGYADLSVSGPTSLTIATKSTPETAVSTLSILVSYPNGTAAQGVGVSASVIGDWYGWDDASGQLTMYSNTDASGVATLVTPSAPVLVSAWASIPVNLPKNQTTIQVTVAGEKVNVTAYWQPSYVSFAAWTLIVPPQTSAGMSLKFQEQPYRVMQYGAAVSSVGQSSAYPSTAAEGSPTYQAFGPGGIPAPTLTQSPSTAAQSSAGQDPRLPADGSVPASGGTLLLIGVVVALALATFGVFLAFMGRQRSP